jgi:hypothetical protein
MSVPYNELPTQDIACAVTFRSPDGLPDDIEDKMQSCCKDADVESFAQDCGLYCHAIGQSVADLTKCFQDAGIQPGWIWCNGNNTATATRTKDDDGPEETGEPNDGDDEEESGASPSPSNAAGRVRVFEEKGVSKVGVGLIVMLASAAFGALL